jgi:signal transduction histidine kinase
MADPVIRAVADATDELREERFWRHLTVAVLAVAIVLLLAVGGVVVVNLRATQARDRQARREQAYTVAVAENRECVSELAREVGALNARQTAGNSFLIASIVRIVADRADAADADVVALVDRADKLIGDAVPLQQAAEDYLAADLLCPTPTPPGG